MGSKRKADNDIGGDDQRYQRRRPTDLPAEHSSTQQASINPFAGINIARVAGDNDNSNNARFPFSGASFVTTTTKPAPASNSNLKNPPNAEQDPAVWEYRQRDINYTFFTQTLELLKDHSKDWGPRVNDWVRTRIAWRNAYKAHAAPNDVSQVTTPHITNTTSKIDPVIHHVNNDSNDQTPSTKATPYTMTPATNTAAGVATPATSLGLGNAVFSPMAAEMSTPAPSSSTAPPVENNDYDDDADTQYHVPKAEEDSYEDVLEVPTIILYKHDGKQFKNTYKGPMRVQSRARSGDQPEAHRMVIRDVANGLLRLNVAITKATSFQFKEDKKNRGEVFFNAITEKESEKYTVKANLAAAKELYDKLISIQKSL